MASKVLERIYGDEFLKPLGPSYKIVVERESPDFLVCDGHDRFGLEVAQVFRDQGPDGSPSKAAESRRTTYLRRLASDYYGSGGMPLLVKANMPDRFNEDTGSLAARLKRERPADPWAESRFEVCGSTFLLTSLPAEAGRYCPWWCVNNSVGWQGSLTTEDVEPVITEKASRLPNYRKVAARVELLLVVDATRASGMVRWRDGSPAPETQGFDAVHLYFHGRVDVRFCWSGGAL